MKTVIAGILATLLTTSQAALLITDHVDIAYRYVPASDTWQTYFVHGGDFDEPDLETPLDHAALPARDRLTTAPINPGDREVRNSNAAFHLIGAPEGAPVWSFPQSNRGYTLPGLRGAHPTGTLLSYANFDPRINGLNRRWQAVELLGVEYSGEATDSPHFSLYTTSGFGVPTFWMSTVDGINANDRYYMLEKSHSHMNWSFTGLGIYRITLRGSAFRASDSQPISSEPHIVTFAVGTLATWRATHFSGPDIVNPVVGVPMADPDGDGLINLLEYAFHLNPNLPDAVPMVAATGLSGLPRVALENVNGEDRLAMEFIRRKASSNPQITYTPQFISNLAANDWSTAGTTTITDVPGTDWERVKIIDSQAIGSMTRRFGRVKITLQSTINY